MVHTFPRTRQLHENSCTTNIKLSFSHSQINSQNKLGPLMRLFCLVVMVLVEIKHGLERTYLTILKLWPHSDCLSLGSMVLRTQIDLKRNDGFQVHGYRKTFLILLKTFIFCRLNWNEKSLVWFWSSSYTAHNAVSCKTIPIEDRCFLRYGRKTF